MTFSKIVTGGLDTCALTSAGAAYCWGYGAMSGIGNGGTTALYTPTAVSGGHVFTDIKVGGGAACGIDTGGAVWCWGYNGYYNLGDGTSTNRSVPTAILGGRTYSKLYGHGSYYSFGYWMSMFCAQ